MKQNIDEQRAHVIHDILKETGVLRQKDIKDKIKEHKNFKTIFLTPYEEKSKKPRPDGWWDTTRRILQYYSRGLSWSKEDKDELFMRIGRGYWTYKGDKNYQDAQIVIDDFIAWNNNTNISNYLKGIKNDEETESIIKIRKNQSKFREFLLKEYNSCPIKGVEHQELLIASHIVDYKDHKDQVDKANPYNGILLSPDVDKLFDKKIISFDIDGKIIFKDLDKYSLDISKMLKDDYKNISLDKKFLTIERISYIKERNRIYKFK